MPQTPLVKLTPDQRFKQAAAILAKGVVRYQRSVRRSESRPEEKSPESSPGGLEVPGETRLSESRRIGGERNPRTREVSHEN